MNAEIITIGNELISGSVVDTNAAFLAERLFSIGIEVRWMVSVGDESADIRDSMLASLGRADVIFITGGLGPTPDDITTEVAAETLGRELVLSEEALHRITELFDKVGLEMTPNNKKQALIPKGSALIENPIGTACGFVVREKETRIFFLPGVPRELMRMTDESVLPLLQREGGGGPKFRTTTLKVFGLSESKIAQRIRDIIHSDQATQISFLPNFPENHIKVTGKALSYQEASKKVSTMAGDITKRLGGYIFGVDDQTLEEVVGEQLRSNGDTIAVAESCTGGMISQQLTNIPGSSDYMRRGIVAYSNSAKVELLNVPASLIDRFGAVSERVAGKMAEGVRQLGKTTLGLGVTGIAGPGGGTPEKPVGLVFISLADEKGTTVNRFNFSGDRSQIRLISSHAALDLTRRYYLR